METWERQMGVEVGGGVVGWWWSGLAVKSWWESSRSSSRGGSRRKGGEEEKLWQTRETVALQRCSLQTLTGSTGGGGGEGGGGEHVRSRKSDRSRGEFVPTCEEPPPPVRDEGKAGWRTLSEDEAFAPLVVKVFFFFFLIQIFIPHGWVGCISPHHQPFTESLDLQKMMEFTIMSC